MTADVRRQQDYSLPKLKINGCPSNVPLPVPREPVETNVNGPLRPSLQLNVPSPFRIVT
jgi:hypothetical protein